MMKKYIYIASTLVVALLFVSCGLAGTNPQSAINVENRKTDIKTELEDAVAKSQLTQAQADTIKRMLLAHCDVYLQSEKISCEQITDMSRRTIESLNHMSITQNVFITIVQTYSIIASSHQARNLLNIGAYCNPMGDSWEWFTNQQSEKDKFDNIRISINHISNSPMYAQTMSKSALDSIVQQLTFETESIEKDSTMAQNKVKEIIVTGMAKLKKTELDNYLLLDIVNVYSTLARIRGIDLKEETDKFYAENYKEPIPLTYPELRKEAEERIEWMRKENLINLKTYQLLKSTMLEDIDALSDEKITKELVEKRLRYSLSRLKDQVGDTEDREYIAGTYYNLAQRHGVDLSDVLNNWMYGF